MDEIFSFDYSLDAKKVKGASVNRYFIKNKTKLIIQISLFSVLFLLFLYSAIFENEKTAIFLSVVCAICIFTILNLPFTEARMSAINFNEQKKYKLAVFSEKIVVSSSDSEKEIETENLKALETEKFYLLETQGRLFPIPKEDLGENEKKAFSQFLKENLLQNYKNYSKSQNN